MSSGGSAGDRRILTTLVPFFIIMMIKILLHSNDKNANLSLCFTVKFIPTPLRGSMDQPCFIRHLEDLQYLFIIFFWGEALTCIDMITVIGIIIFRVFVKKGGIFFEIDWNR